MTQTYWHFAGTNEQGVPVLGYGDGRTIRVGETLRVEGKPVLCRHGLHASAKIMDALRYARGAVICEVTLGGTVVHDDDKSVAQERTVVAMTTEEEGKRILGVFKRWCALQVINLWEAPDEVRRYLETGDESLRGAAHDAAYAHAAAHAAAYAHDAAAAAHAAAAFAHDAAHAAAAAAHAAAAFAHDAAHAAAAQEKKLIELVRESIYQEAS